MILFYDDWDEFGAQPDWNTKNKSFVDLCGVYKAMGIKNYMWPLAIYDSGLIGVDPFDQGLDQEMKRRIAIECKLNFSYFIREIARDPQGSPEHPLLFQANRGVSALYWLYFNHILVILIMIRQTGKSFGDSWLDTWINNIGARGNETSALLKDDKLRTRTIERLKSMELTLPPYLRMRTNKDAANTEVYRIGALDNTYKGYVPNASEKMADLLGRGMTSPNIKCDEFAYTKCNWITVPVMLSSAQAAREVARAKNAPYGTVLLTTTGKRDTPEGRYAYNFTNSAAIFNDRWFDLSGPEELIEVVKKAGDGKNIRVNATFNHRQLGKTDEWLRDRLSDAAQDLEGDQVAVRADYFNEWPSGSNSSPFTIEIAAAMRESEAYEVYTEITYPDAYSMRWHYTEEERRQKLSSAPHILGNDPSEAVGRDSIGFVLVNAYTGETAMAADVSEGNIIAYFRWVGNFLLDNPSVTLNIERKSTGSSCVDYVAEFLLSKGINPFTRIFNQIVQNKDEHIEKFKEIERIFSSRDNLAVKYKKYIGWNTAGAGSTARSELFGRVLGTASKLGGPVMRDRKLILQTLGLQTINGRLDHQPGEHDDLTISWLLCFWLMSQGKNLAYYGIDPSQVLVENIKYKEGLKEVSKYERYLAQQARIDVERITEELKESTNEYLAAKLERDLALAAANLSEKDRSMVAVDDLISKLRDERKRKIGRPTYAALQRR